MMREEYLALVQPWSPDKTTARQTRSRSTPPDSVPAPPSQGELQMSDTFTVSWKITASFFRWYWITCEVRRPGRPAVRIRFYFRV